MLSKVLYDFAQHSYIIAKFFPCCLSFKYFYLLWPCPYSFAPFSQVNICTVLCFCPTSSFLSNILKICSAFPQCSYAIVWLFQYSLSLSHHFKGFAWLYQCSYYSITPFYQCTLIFPNISKANIPNILPMLLQHCKISPNIPRVLPPFL